jgi:hypothetical protein
VVGTTLYFVADDELGGLELWKLDVQAPACDLAVVHDADGVPRTGTWVYTTSCPALGGNTLDEALKLAAPADDSDLAGESYSGGSPGLTLYQEACGTTCTAVIRLVKNGANGLVHFFKQ